MLVYVTKNSNCYTRGQWYDLDAKLIDVIRNTFPTGINNRIVIEVNGFGSLPTTIWEAFEMEPNDKVKITTTPIPLRNHIVGIKWAQVIERRNYRRTLRRQQKLLQCSA